MENFSFWRLSIFLFICLFHLKSFSQNQLSEETAKKIIDSSVSRDEIEGIYTVVDQQEVFHCELGATKLDPVKKTGYFIIYRDNGNFVLKAINCVFYPENLISGNTISKSIIDNSYTISVRWNASNNRSNQEEITKSSIVSKNNSLFFTILSPLQKCPFFRSDEQFLLTKIYPEERSLNKEPNNPTTAAISTGTGFALNNQGYIVTNYHVIENSNKIKVKGINGNFQASIPAKVIAVDKNNDLAIIKLADPSFMISGTIPYSFKFNKTEVGENVFTLGYPLLDKMGTEIKLTNGIISSKSGYKGDITTYQISVPIQPGNSGGPLFNNSGNIIGIVNAKLGGAENASYAIKSSYLRNLIENTDEKIPLPSNNTLLNKSLSNQASILKNFIYTIEVSQ